MFFFSESGMCRSISRWYLLVVFEVSCCVRVENGSSGFLTWFLRPFFNSLLRDLNLSLTSCPSLRQIRHPCVLLLRIPLTVWRKYPKQRNAGCRYQRSSLLLLQTVYGGQMSQRMAILLLKQFLTFGTSQGNTSITSHTQYSFRPELFIFWFITWLKTWMP